jgi:hypothetical protein
MIADGAGGTIVVWQDNRNDSGDIYAQRLDAYGNALWDANGVPVILEESAQIDPRLCPDGSGGAIVVWLCNRFDTHDLRAQRLDADGNRLWSVYGVTVVANSARQLNPRLIPDGSGGAFVSWEDERSGGWDIYAQHLQGSNGQRLWLTDGFIVCDAAGDQYGPWIISDDDGGIIVSWIDERPSASGIYAQRLHASSGHAWTIDGVICCPLATYMGHLRSIPDEAGGAILVWQDTRVEGYYLLFAQRIDADGLRLWGPDGTRVSVNYADQMNPCLAPDGAGGVYVGWIDSRDTNDIYGQRLNQYGYIQWDGGGNQVSVSPGWETDVEVCAATGGGALFAWKDHRNDQYDIYAQKMNGLGAPLWTPGGEAVCTEATQEQRRPKIVSDADGGAIVAWEDHRNETIFYDIYAQRMERHGYWGYPSGTIESVQDVGGDQGGWVHVTWSSSRLDGGGGEVLGYTVWRRVDEGSAWQNVGTMSAFGVPFYTEIVATTADSSASDPALFDFMVTANTSDADVHWDSQIVSGYSVDNIAPGMPSELEGEASWNPPSLTLSWTPVSDPDLDHYAIYLTVGEEAAKVLGQPLGFTEETFFVIEDWSPGPDDIYVVTAVDSSGNESEAASLHLETITSVGGSPQARSFLGQNIPNPFNPQTVIPFKLGMREVVSLRVYDPQGRLVRVILAGDLLAQGHHEIAWDGRDDSGRRVSSGTYFYRLEAGQYSETKRMVLVK